MKRFIVHIKRTDEPNLNFTAQVEAINIKAAIAYTAQLAFNHNRAANNDRDMARMYKQVSAIDYAIQLVHDIEDDHWIADNTYLYLPERRYEIVVAFECGNIIQGLDISQPVHA